MKIPLFDLDWTLIAKTQKNIHRKAFYFVFEKVYGINNAHIEPIEGRIDNQIIIETLSPFLSVEEIKNKLSKATKTMSNYLLEHKNEDTYPVLPGVINLLEVLREKKIPAGLLTGNVEEIAWQKLELAGIKKYFKFGAFGDKAYKRVELVEMARRNAEKVLGITLNIQDLVLVGDTPRDISCAKDTGAKVIAVASGPDPIEKLREGNPDLLVNSLEEKDKILNFLNN